MQALILAGGIGSRLGKRVKNIPKTLISVNNEPFLMKIINRLISQGVTDIILCLVYKSE